MIYRKNGPYTPFACLITYCQCFTKCSFDSHRGMRSYGSEWRIENTFCTYYYSLLSFLMQLLIYRKPILAMRRLRPNKVLELKTGRFLGANTKKRPLIVAPCDNRCTLRSWRHTGSGNALENLLNFSGTSSEWIIPKSISLILDELNEGNQQSPWVRSV